jgi:hypothetical protein
MSEAFFGGGIWRSVFVAHFSSAFGQFHHSCYPSVAHLTCANSLLSASLDNDIPLKHERLSGNGQRSGAFLDMNGWRHWQSENVGSHLDDMYVEMALSCYVW